MRKVTANLSQTCGCAVAEYLLQFCGIECKFAVPSYEYKGLNELVPADPLYLKLTVVLQSNGEHGREVKRKALNGWNRWRKDTGVI